jgi:hypothetical protein
MKQIRKTQSLEGTSDALQRQCGRREGYSPLKN